MTTDLTPFAQDPAATPVLAMMRDGRWRKARDAAKDLCKRERGRYLPLLIEANVGLVREMLAKGLVKEAATVVDYLASIAPPALVTMLREEITTPVVKRTVSHPGNAAGAEWWAAALRVDQALAASRKCSPADLAAIDLLAADPFTPLLTDADERALRLAAELAAVRAACAATGDGRWDEARESMRALPRQSVFRHWRMFLRGLRCLFDDQLDTARQCFADLPPHGALARAARAFDATLVVSGPVAPANVRVPLYLAATGQPAAWGGPIVAACSSWKAGRRIQAFDDLRVGMKGSFPANMPGLAAALTEVVLPYHERMNDADFDLSDRLLDYIDSLRGKMDGLPPDAQLAIIRPMCLASADDSTPANLERSWRMVIDLWNRLHGRNPARDSVAWHWLGETLTKTPAGPFPFPFGDSKGDHRRARKALDQAVDCDPSNEVAWLSLLALLARQRDTKTRNRLLDDLVKRFPRNKTILMEAGSRAQERKAFDKALGFLEAALALDPLDKTVKRNMLVAWVMQIREWLAKGRPAAALWDRMEPLLEDHPGRDFMMLVRWLARIRRAVLDPDPAAAQLARDDAVLMAPSPIERLFAEHSFAAVYRIQPRPYWSREWKESLAGGQPDWKCLCNLLDLLAFLTQIKEWRWLDNKNAGDRLRDILNVLINSGLKKDPDGVLALLDHVDVIRKNSTDMAWDTVISCLEKVSSTLDRQAAPGNKKADPRLRLATLILRNRFGANRFMTSTAFLRDLDSVSAAATTAGMPAVAQRAKELRDEIERGDASQHSGFDQMPDDGYDDDDYDDDDDAVDPFSGPHNPMEMFKGMEILLGKLAQALRDKDSHTIEAIRGTMLDLGIGQDGFVLACSVAAASLLEKTLPPPPPPRTKKPAKPPREPFVDPNQAELF